MKKLFLLMVFSISSLAMGVERNGNNYYEVCVPAYNSCVVGVFTKFGQFAALLREGQSMPGVGLLGDIFKIGPYGELVARIREPEYEALVAAGLERINVDINNIQPEIDKVQSQIDGNLARCLVQTALCVGTGLSALGSSGLTITLAGLACYSAYQTCEDLDRANQDLFSKRKELKEKLKEEAEKENGGAGAGKNDDGGGGGEGGHPSPGPGGAYHPPSGPSPLPGGIITGSEGGGGSGPHKPIIFN